MLDLGVTHVINTGEQEIRIDPTKFAKQGICYKGFICKVSSVLVITKQRLINKLNSQNPPILDLTKPNHSYQK